MSAQDEDPSPEDRDLSTDPQFLAFVEGQGGLGLDPLSDDGLRLQAEYIKLVGDHPLDVLKSLSRNVFVKPSDRISAARTLLEYGARKVPAQLDLNAKGTALTIDASQLSGLSEKELAMLEKLLSKARANDLR